MGLGLFGGWFLLQGSVHALDVEDGSVLSRKLRFEQLMCTLNGCDAVCG